MRSLPIIIVVMLALLVDSVHLMAQSTAGRSVLKGRVVDDSNELWQEPESMSGASAKTKWHDAAEVVAARMKTDKNMYFIDSEGFLGGDHIATADGTHPTDLGFTRMLEVISPKLKKILKKYGIK